MHAIRVAFECRGGLPDRRSDFVGPYIEVKIEAALVADSTGEAAAVKLFEVIRRLFRNVRSRIHRVYRKVLGIFGTSCPDNLCLEAVRVPQAILGQVTEVTAIGWTVVDMGASPSSASGGRCPTFKGRWGIPEVAGTDGICKG